MQIDFSTACRKGYTFDKKKNTFKPIVSSKHSSNEQLVKLEVNNQKNSKSLDNAFSLVGTAEYVSPEALNSVRSANSDYFAADLWALGCIIYKFFEGCTPFCEQNDIKTINNILERNESTKLSFSSTTPKEVIDIVTSLLNINPEERLGMKNFEDLKKHPFFDGIDFSNIDNLYPPDEYIIQLMTKPKKVKSSVSYTELNFNSIFKVENIDSNEGKKEEKKEEQIEMGRISYNLVKNSNSDNIIESEEEYNNSLRSSSLVTNKKPSVRIHSESITKKKKSNFDKNCKYMNLEENALVLEGKSYFILLNI